MTMNELEWLQTQEEPPEPDTASARAALLTHMQTAPRDAVPTAGLREDFAEAAPVAFVGDATTSEGADAYTTLRRRAAAELGDSPSAPRPRRPRPSKRERRAEAAHARRAAWRPRLALASAAALIAATVAVAWPTGDDPGKRFAAPVGPAPAVVEAPLVRLSQKIAAEPDPKGDATLVIRSQEDPHGKSILGYDLYLDDGRYYHGATKDALKSAALNSRHHEPLVKAAIAAPDLPADRARHEMDLAVGGGNAPKVERSIEDNHVWTGSMDALLAGAGRSDVRAGVMTLLATIDSVKVSEVSKSLKLSAAVFKDDYTESLFVNAQTGVPEKFVGGAPGEPPAVTIDYDVKRVTAADWADTSATDDADQAPRAGRPEDQARARRASRR